MRYGTEDYHSVVQGIKIFLTPSQPEPDEGGEGGADGQEEEAEEEAEEEEEDEEDEGLMTCSELPILKTCV